MILLVDIDGVLKNGDEQLPGASAFFEFIKERDDLKVSLLSNSTMMTGKEVGLFFGKKLPEKVKILTALDIAIDYANKLGAVKVYCAPDAIKHFDSKVISDQPKAIIVGDIGEKWNYDTMNEMFTHVNNGCELVAIQMNKFGIKNGSLKMDSGAFLKSIQFATDCKINLLGKPGNAFFEAGLKLSNYDGKEEKWMIGDDLIGDIEGGQNAGCKTILTLSGKTNQEKLTNSRVQPNRVIKSIDEAIQLFDNIK